MESLNTAIAEEHIGGFLREFLHELERQGIDYALARDYESLPQALDGRDLDILVKESDFERAYRTLVSIARSLSARVFKIDQEADTYAWAFVVHCDPPFWGLHVDFVRPRCASWRGCCFVDATAAMKRKIHPQGIPTLRRDDIVFMQFLRDIVGSLHLRDKYRLPVRQLYFSDPTGFTRSLRNTFGKRAADQLVGLCREGKFDHLETVGKRLRRGLMIKSLLRRPIETARNMLRYLAWRCGEYLRPNGIVVAVVVPDGSNQGKLIEQVQDEIYQLTRSKPRLYHRRPGLLPDLNPKRKGPFYSTLHRIYYSVDYILGYWLLVRPYLGRKSLVAIFDGHLHDFARPFLIPKPAAVISLAPDPRSNVPTCQPSSVQPANVPDQIDAREIVRAILEALATRLNGREK